MAKGRLKRRLIAFAFRSMAGGVDERSAYASTIGFYRASGQAWAKRLG